MTFPIWMVLDIIIEPCIYLEITSADCTSISQNTMYVTDFPDPIPNLRRSSPCLSRLRCLKASPVVHEGDPSHHPHTDQNHKHIDIMTP